MGKHKIGTQTLGRVNRRVPTALVVAAGGEGRVVAEGGRIVAKPVAGRSLPKR